MTFKHSKKLVVALVLTLLCSVFFLANRNSEKQPSNTWGEFAEGLTISSNKHQSPWRAEVSLCVVTVSRDFDADCENAQERLFDKIVLDLSEIESVSGISSGEKSLIRFQPHQDVLAKLNTASEIALDRTGYSAGGVEYIETQHQAALSYLIDSGVKSIRTGRTCQMERVLNWGVSGEFKFPLPTNVYSTVRPKISNFIKSCRRN